MIDRQSFAHAIDCIDLIRCLNEQVIAVHGNKDTKAKKVADYNEEALNNAVIFITSDRLEKLLDELIEVPAVVLTDYVNLDSIQVTEIQCVFIVVRNPRLCFARIARAYTGIPQPSGVHSTAVISPRAEFDDSVSIGPYAVVGDVSIGAHSIIESHCRIEDGVSIGKNVQIRHDVSIGGPGFGFEWNEQGVLEAFPQLGFVEILDDVEVGSGTCIDRGALVATRIESGTKIDSLVYIAHNVSIGPNCLVCGSAVLCGGVTIGQQSFIGAGAHVRQNVTINENSTVGIASVVVNDVPAGVTVAGNPARIMGAI